MKLLLSHGRTHPTEKLAGWGPSGQPIQHINSAHFTPTHLVLERNYQPPIMLRIVDDLVVGPDGMFYGDLEFQDDENLCRGQLMVTTCDRKQLCSYVHITYLTTFGCDIDIDNLPDLFPNGSIREVHR